MRGERSADVRTRVQAAGAQPLLRAAMQRLRLSAGLPPGMKLARTIADLEDGAEG